MATAISATWYAPNDNYKSAIGHVLASAANESDHSYGPVASLVTLYRYTRDSVVEGISTYYGVLLLVLMIAYAARRLFQREASRSQRIRAPFAAAVLLFAWPAAVFALPPIP